MNNSTKLISIKLAHTAIWLFYNLVIFYLAYALIVNKIDQWVWICLGLILLEGIILVIFKLTCPITLIARKYSDSTNDNFDIYLPNWLAKYTKVIYTSITVVLVVLLIYRLYS